MDKINKIRFMIAMIAESIDYFRIVPRLILVGYSIMFYQVVSWFMAL